MGRRILVDNKKGLHLAVGDCVRVHFFATVPLDGDLLAAAGKVVSQEPRRTRLSRADPRHPGRERVVAANIDRVVLVTAATDPPFRAAFVERVLEAAEAGGAPCLLLINKCDLPHDEAALSRDLAPFTDRVPVRRMSVTAGLGLLDLEEHLAGEQIALVGPSGVGKSSLANALHPGQTRSTGVVRDYDGKGRHTTTRAQLLFARRGIVLIDTPGIRAFAVSPADERSLADTFPEFARFSSKCRFRNCRHEGETACAVRDAANRGTLSLARYRSYLQRLEAGGSSDP